MAKVFNCQQLGMDCDFQARGETEADVLKQCAEHAKSVHGMEQVPAEIVEKVRSGIHDEPARPAK